MNKHIGTYQLLAALRNHWQRPVNPVYRIGLRNGLTWDEAVVDRHSLSLVRVGFGLLGAIIILMAAKILTNQNSTLIDALVNLLIQATCLSVLGVLGFGLLIATFLWPIAVAVVASDIIVRDRERRTWSALLVTPFDWSDLLTAKLAAALNWLNRPFEFLLWVQGVLLLVVFILIFGQVEHFAEFSPLAVIGLAALSGIQFVIARLQDYASASVIGLLASLTWESRQVAWTAALVGAMGLVLTRLAFTALLMSQLKLESPQALALILATGPTAALTLALPLPLAGGLLIALPLSREWLIRRGYRWVLAHLSDAAGSG